MSHEVEIIIDCGLGEFVYSAPVNPSTLYDCLWYAWDDAEEECEQAYRAWCPGGDAGAYAVYRAAQDRADAAQDALAARHVEPSLVPERGRRSAPPDAVSGQAPAIP
jgi:hypothetical protein